MGVSPRLLLGRRGCSHGLLHLATADVAGVGEGIPWPHGLGQSFQTSIPHSFAIVHHGVQNPNDGVHSRPPKPASLSLLSPSTFSRLLNMPRRRHLQNLLLQTPNMQDLNPRLLQPPPPHILPHKRLRLPNPTNNPPNPRPPIRAPQPQNPLHARQIPRRALIARLHRRVQHYILRQVRT